MHLTLTESYIRCLGTDRIRAYERFYGGPTVHMPERVDEWSKTAQLILLFFILLSLQRFAAGDQIDYLVMNRSVSPRSLSVYSSDMILRDSRVICMHVD